MNSETVVAGRVLGLTAEDEEDDGVHGDRMKPLSSFVSNKSVKKLVRIPSSVKAKHSSLKITKESTHIEADPSNVSVIHKIIKRKRSIWDEGKNYPLTAKGQGRTYG
eukprot:Gb_34066 [translate_table: standard]